MTKRGSFRWNTIEVEKSKRPSPREGNSIWEYEQKVWIFGGYGESPLHGYLNDHGNYERHYFEIGHGSNNQLHCFDPSVQTWTNLKCLGNVPSPHFWVCGAIIEDKVWIYENAFTNDELSELDMHSLVWTHIETSFPRPPNTLKVSLTPITGNLLILHRSFGKEQFTWVLDVQSYTWREHWNSGNKVSRHTGTAGLYNNVILLEDNLMDPDETGMVSPVVSVMLEPKSLQQHAMTTIHKNRTTLPWKTLPPQLIRQRSFPLKMK